LNSRGLYIFGVWMRVLREKERSGSLLDQPSKFINPESRHQSCYPVISTAKPRKLLNCVKRFDYRRRSTFKDIEFVISWFMAGKYLCLNCSTASSESKASGDQTARHLLSEMFFRYL
ncbi:hypothetical protein RRG08_003014, partial [Elysia crispata]